MSLDLVRRHSSVDSADKTLTVYQILTNDDEVCIPRLSCIIIAVRSNAAFSNWVPLHRRSPKSSSVCVVHFIFEDVKWSIFSLARIHSIFVDLNKKEYLFCLLGFENTGRMNYENMSATAPAVAKVIFYFWRCQMIYIQPCWRLRS